MLEISDWGLNSGFFVAECSLRVALLVIGVFRPLNLVKKKTTWAPYEQAKTVLRYFFSFCDDIRKKRAYDESLTSTTPGKLF